MIKSRMLACVKWTCIGSSSVKYKRFSDYNMMRSIFCGICLGLELTCLILIETALRSSSNDMGRFAAAIHQNTFCTSFRCFETAIIRDKAWLNVSYKSFGRLRRACRMSSL